MQIDGGKICCNVIYFFIYFVLKLQYYSGCFSSDLTLYDYKKKLCLTNMHVSFSFN